MRDEVVRQATISAEIVEIAKQDAAAGPTRTGHPRRDYAPYRSSLLRHPTHELVRVDPEEVERLSPAFGHTDVDILESDLTIQHTGEPLGERINVFGRVVD
ncbi:MAG: protocatechuate 3,4-dioxygenase, beta subunit, partial [Actinomycetota bacterium]|nr:protocatechuate 3,4-dioxygenase, beta subunit [Actinomycetota bacterium]